MFDAMKNLSQLPQMMAKAKAAQEKMKQLQEELTDQRFTADAGAGVVEATVDGRLLLVDLKIDADRLGTGDLGGADVEILQQVTTQAVNAAQAKAQEAMRRAMAKLAEDAGLPGDMMGELPG
jgi:DNA-binding YbaB/EbfC family protein